MCKLLAICPRKNNIIYFRGQIDNNLHTQIILFILHGQIANKVHQLGQIANNVNTQINNKVADPSLGGWQVVAAGSAQLNNLYLRLIKLFTHTLLAASSAVAYRLLYSNVASDS